MQKKFNRVDIWLSLLLTICVIMGVYLALNVLASTPRYASVKINWISILSILTLALSLITWFSTRRYYKKKLADEERELAKKTIRKNFELLRVANRTLDNIDIKAGAILNSGNEGVLDRALAYEFVQNIRNQVVEVYNGIGVCIEDWRVVLTEEFEEIERKERALEKLVMDQINKARKLRELERDNAPEKEIHAAKTDLARLAEKQRDLQSAIFTESKKLLGAPIASITNIGCPSPTQPKVENLLKQPAMLKEYDIDIS